MISTVRLKTVHRQEQNNRKFVCVMNDLAKTQQDLYEGYIEKEKHEAEQESDKSIVVTRRNIVRQRVLKKCMKSKREDVANSNATNIYGRYHGVPVEQIAGQIDTFLEKNHPKIRRRQKIDDLFQEAYSKGAILDNATIHNKVQDYFERPLVEVQEVEKFENGKVKTKSKKPTFPALSNSFYTGNFHNSRNPPTKQSFQKQSESTEDLQRKLFVKRKVSKFLNEDVPDNVSVHSETTAANICMLHNKQPRPLTLPPIKIGTDSVVPHRIPKQKPDCIAELIARIHKAKDSREKKKKIHTEKREKRLQHERVYGIGNTMLDANCVESSYGSIGRDKRVHGKVDSSDGSIDHDKIVHGYNNSTLDANCWHVESSNGSIGDLDDNAWRRDEKATINSKLATDDKERNKKKNRIQLPALHIRSSQKKM